MILSYAKPFNKKMHEQPEKILKKEKMYEWFFNPLNR